MRKLQAFIIGCVALFLVQGCGDGGSKIELSELDLLGQGLPIVIQAPADPLIESNTLGIYRVVSVRRNPDFNVDIYESDVTSRNTAAIKARLLRDVQEHPFFQKIITDDEQGFIYQTAVDSNYINHGFRYFKLQGDKEYVFQTGITGQYTLEQVEVMYSAVQGSE